MGDESSHNRYREVRKLGAGNFGAAWLVEDLQCDRQLRVLKRVFVGTLKQTDTAGALKEARLLSQLDHPNILRFHESYIDKDFVCIVTEYCEGGDLAECIETHKGRGEIINQQQVLDWFVQLTMALKYLHERRVLHRDLKSKNVFLRRGVIKLGDFGIARVLMGTMDEATTFAGTPYYMSPEALQGIGYNDKSDIWALGCILYEMCTLKHAFDGAGLLSLLYQICEGDVPQIPDHYSPELKQLSSLLWQRDPIQRPSAVAILNLPFIRRHMQKWQFRLSKRSHRSIDEEKERIRNEIGHTKKSSRHHNNARPHDADRLDATPMSEDAWDTSSSSPAISGVNHAQQYGSPGMPTTPAVVDEKHLTPRERMKLRKLRASEERAAQLKQAAMQQRLENRSRQQHTRDHLQSSNLVHALYGKKAGQQTVRHTSEQMVEGMSKLRVTDDGTLTPTNLTGTTGIDTLLNGDDTLRPVSPPELIHREQMQEHPPFSRTASEIDEFELVAANAALFLASSVSGITQDSIAVDAVQSQSNNAQRQVNQMSPHQQQELELADGLGSNIGEPRQNEAILSADDRPIRPVSKTGAIISPSTHSSIRTSHVTYHKGVLQPTPQSAGLMGRSRLPGAVEQHRLQDSIRSTHQQPMLPLPIPSMVTSPSSVTDRPSSGRISSGRRRELGPDSVSVSHIVPVTTASPQGSLLSKPGSSGYNSSAPLQSTSSSQSHTHSRSGSARNLKSPTLLDLITPSTPSLASVSREPSVSVNSSGSLSATYRQVSAETSGRRRSGSGRNADQLSLSGPMTFASWMASQVTTADDTDIDERDELDPEQSFLSQSLNSSQRRVGLSSTLPRGRPRDGYEPTVRLDDSVVQESIIEMPVRRRPTSGRRSFPRDSNSSPPLFENDVSELEQMYLDTAEFESEEEEVDEGWEGSLSQELHQVQTYMRDVMSNSVLHTTSDPDVHDPDPIRTQRMAQLRKEGQRLLGSQFVPVYNYLKAARLKRLEETEIRKELEKMAEYRNCFVVDQLVYMECFT
eukprot:m.134330 g.134330  ORF g.134330 m.134330 type:complete len:1026 (+) comp15818_c0_seq2:182-3259(+)